MAKMNSYEAVYAHGMLKAIAAAIEGLRDYLSKFEVEPTIIRAVESIAESAKILGTVVEGIKHHE